MSITLHQLGTVGQSMEKAVKLAELDNDRVDVVFNGLKIPVYKDSARMGCVLYDILFDLRSNGVEIPDWLLIESERKKK